MRILISADIINNTIHVNNLFGYTFIGKIIIKYLGVNIYENEIELVKDSILWFSPYPKMTDISNINVTLLDNDNIEVFSDTPLVYVTYMRADNTELNNLSEFIKSQNVEIKNIVEIGSFQGESTLIFQENFSNSKIYAIDPWINNYDEREDVINNYNMIDIENNFDMLTKKYSNIIKIKMFSNEFANLIMDKSIDFIYIDGDHSYKGISADILNWKNKIKQGGFICGHDYNNLQIDTVVKAIKENFPNHKINLFGPSWAIQNI